MPEQVTTLGRELVRRKLPDKYKHYADGVLDKKSITKMMTDIALHDPDDYVDILQDLNNIGQAVVSTYGRDTALPYADAVPGKETRKLNEQLRILRDRIMDDPKLTEEQKEQKIIELAAKYTDKVQAAVFEDNDKRHTSLASQINSGSRGNKTQLQQLQFGNMLMVDALDRPIPFLHTEPYMSGTSPMAYWVSASSGRKGFWDVQKATGQSGYMGKQVTATTQATPIEKADCGTTDTGIPFPADDSKNIGAVLLRPFHNHPAGSIVTDDMVSEAKEGEEMILRSPLTCKCKYGVCQKCNGLGENGKFPAIGEYVALNAARSYVEAVTQGGLGCLAPDTLVRMADWSVKEIKDIRPGDMVMGVTDKFGLEPAEVVRIFDNGIKAMDEWELNDNGTKSTIICTENHRMAGEFQDGDSMEEIRFVEWPVILDETGGKHYGVLNVTRSRISKALDIEVDNGTSWYLLANGMVTHNSKHKGGVGGAIKEDPEGADQPHGFDRLEQFIMGSPGAFKGAAVLSPKEGQVTSVREAPQGGHYITIGQEVLYANPYRTVKVKPGDKVQPGDVLTNGVPNPYEVTELKGLGQGRKYFMSKLNTTLNELGWGTDRRNLEAFSRSMISKVKITDPDGFGKYLPGDIADYNEITADWEPREDAVTEPVSKAVNKYLEKPVLNYSIGTKITPGVAEDLQKHGFNTVTANSRELPFTAQFLRPSAVLQNDSRWLPRLAGERLRDSLFDAARRGMMDEYDSPSYIDKMIIAPFKPGA